MGGTLDLLVSPCLLSPILIRLRSTVSSVARCAFSRLSFDLGMWSVWPGRFPLQRVRPACITGTGCSSSLLPSILLVVDRFVSYSSSTLPACLLAATSVASSCSTCAAGAMSTFVSIRFANSPTRQPGRLPCNAAAPTFRPFAPSAWIWTMAVLLVLRVSRRTLPMGFSRLRTSSFRRLRARSVRATVVVIIRSAISCGLRLILPMCLGVSPSMPPRI